MASETDMEPELCCQEAKNDFDLQIFINSLFNILEVFKMFTFYYINLIIIGAVLTFTLYIMYKSFWKPILYTKELIDVGYEHLPTKDRMLHIFRAQKNRQMGSKLPPPYPNGWFSLVESQDLKVGAVKSVDALGLNLCVYRGEDGVARVVDAYCPHLGANLAIGGSVCGNCIECPFHQWMFADDGACITIPGLDTVPKGISIKTYQTMEVDGSVWMWYHVDDEPPMWNVEESEEMKTWGYRGRNEFIVNAHIQEIPENGADVAHLNAVHTDSILCDLGSRFPCLSDLIGYHVWHAEWAKTDEEHITVIKIDHKYRIMKMDLFPFQVIVHQIGPAHVRLRFKSPLGPIIITQSVTPLGPLLQKVVHRVFTPYYVAALGPFMVLSEAYQFKRDVQIWNNKRYVNTPTYAKTDKTIRAFRTWFSQFYSNNSISLRDAMQNPLDW